VTARIAIAAVVLVIAAGRARADDACAKTGERAGDAASGPLMAGNGPADFGAIPEVCGATDGLLRLRGSLLIASTMPDYYGSIFAGGTLRGRFRLADRTTLSFAADVFDYRYVNNGGLASHGVSAGPGTVTLQQAFAFTTQTEAAAYLRALAPLDTARQSGVETGVELGGGLRMRAGARWIIDGGLAVTAPLDIVGGRTHLRVEPVALAEAWLRLRPSAALCGGVNMRVNAAPTFQLGALVPRLGARVMVRRRWWTALLIEVPVAGEDRTDLIAGLYLGYVP
jgi:hypothetical protein